MVLKGLRDWIEAKGSVAFVLLSFMCLGLAAMAVIGCIVAALVYFGILPYVPLGLLVCAVALVSGFGIATALGWVD